MTEMSELFTLMDRFWELGIPAHPLGPLNNFYHETLRIPSTITSITNDGHLFPDKPLGALWLSSGVQEDDGVVTDWRDFMVRDMSMTKAEMEEYSTLKPIFNTTHFYIVLDETNWVNLPKFWDEDAEAWPVEDTFSFASYTERKSVPWLKLLEAGVSAVAIDGRYERNHFYGYDVDSLLLLNGAAVADFEPVKGYLHDKLWDSGEIFTW